VAASTCWEKITAVGWLLDIASVQTSTVYDDELQETAPGTEPLIELAASPAPITKQGPLLEIVFEH
jgi:hypothetical protein